MRLGPARGRDVKKMDKPYTCREVLFTCSNGWTIERVSAEDFKMEGFFMGHCLGESNSGRYTEILSLREPDGTPHVTMCDSVMTGRCNQAPKERYATLVREFRPDAKDYVPTDYALEWSATYRRDVVPEV